MDVEMEFEAFSDLTNIQSFFYGQSVFLTGVTGFLGKVVLEKILRCCPGIGMVYIHMRPKKGLTSMQRVEKLFKLELFREVKNVFPHFRKRVQVVEGDITDIRLGLSLEDFEKIHQNVSIVIHSAASINFTDPIKIAVQHNVISTQRILDLCREMPNIKAVIHVSTSFVKRQEDYTVLEEVPKCKVDPVKFLEALEWMDENCQAACEKFLIQDKICNLNTYLVTKAFAEELIEKKKEDLPIGIVRPSYICPTWKEPFPGWVDSIQGISGLLIAIFKGVLRTLCAAKNIKLNAIPVDVVANSILASAWHVGTTKPVPLFIINCVMDYESLPDIFEDTLRFVLKKKDEYALVNIFRCPDLTIYNKSLAYKVHVIIDQWIPALIIDSFIFIFTGKTILIKVYSKIHIIYDLFYKVCRDPWKCRRDNYIDLEDKLSEGDKKIFFMHVDCLDWNDYMEKNLREGRQYLAREDPSSIPYAQKKAKIWRTVTTILKWSIILYFFHYLFNLSFLSKNIEEQFRTQDT